MDKIKDKYLDSLKKELKSKVLPYDTTENINELINIYEQRIISLYNQVNVLKKSCVSLRSKLNKP